MVLKRIIRLLRGRTEEPVNVRESLSKQYIKGTGLEIGALHRPLPVSDDVVVKNVDLVSCEDNIKKFPELNSSEISKTDYIDDGFVLSVIPESSQDFLIANHVLEHAPNPIQVMVNWSRIIKENGILFITIPIAETCFDRGRIQTSLEHIIDDYQLYNEKQLDKIDKKNKEHLLEWINISEFNIYKERDPNYELPSAEAIEKRIGEANMEQQEMHFHTFSVDSFEKFLKYFESEVDISFSVEDLQVNVGEVVAILKKKNM